MNNVKNLNTIIKLKSKLLTIKANTPLRQTFRKIQKSKKLDFVYVEKPKVSQMSAVLISRLLGKKFIWIQGFSNPPVANFVEKFLLTQADKLVVADEKNAYKLKKLGIKKSKIQLIKI